MEPLQFHPVLKRIRWGGRRLGTVLGKPIGEAKGEPPFAGTLRHHGWRAVETKLPTLAEGVDRAVIAPAEVEV